MTAVTIHVVELLPDAAAPVAVTGFKLTYVSTLPAVKNAGPLPSFTRVHPVQPAVS